MNNPSPSNIEQKLSALYAVDPASDFVNRLEKDLLAHKQQTAKLPAWRLWRTNLQQSRGWTRFALAGAVILTLAVLLFATPQGRAWAQEILHFFTNVTVPRWVNPNAAQLVTQPTYTEPEFLAECGGYNAPTCTVQQVRDMVGFEVKGLSKLPDGMLFAGATGSPESVLLVYQNGQTGALLITEEPWSELAAQQSEVGASAAIETVSIAPLADPGKLIGGEYVVGAWDGPIFSHWNASPDMQSLRWRDGDTLYSMMSAGLNEYQGQLLDKAGMAALAAAMTTDPLVLAATPAPSNLPIMASPTPGPSYYFGLTAQEIEAVAGFKVIEPTWLPGEYAFNHAFYLADTGNVCLYYDNPSHSTYLPSLVIVENASGTLPDVPEWTRRSYEGWDVTDPALFDTPTSTLPVSGALGGQATLSEAGQSVKSLCGGDGPIQDRTLMWKTANGRSFIITAFKGPMEPFITTLEVRRLAENLNGVSTLPNDMLDPERLPSLQAAESLRGSEFPVPAKTDGQIFSYAQYDEASHTLNLLYGMLVITIQSGTTETLESVLAQNPDVYQQLTVRGHPALYIQGCQWAGQDKYDWNCQFGPQVLTWFENGTKYQVTSNDSTKSTLEILVGIAESMK